MVTSVSTISSPEITNPAIVESSGPVRERLKLWQEELGGPNDNDLRAFENYQSRDDISNGMASTMTFGAKSDEELWDTEREDAGEGDGEELITIGLFLKPGDVVEISQPGCEPVLAVFVQQIDVRSQFYSVNGRWCHALLRTISFAIPGCIDPALIQPLVPYLPTRPNEAAHKSAPIHVPRDLGVPVQHILERMTQESEKIYRENATILDNAYSSLADQTRMRMMTLTQIAKTLLAPRDPTWTSSPAALLAVRKALHHNEFRFRSDARSQRLTNVFSIRPKNDVETVETVQGWVRAYEEYEAINASMTDTQPIPSKGAIYIAQFAKKAQRLVAISRKYRNPTQGIVGPSKILPTFQDQSSTFQVVWGEEFSGTDRQIISFLQAWVLTSQFPNMPTLHSACSTILRATKCYSDRVLNKFDGRILLDKELGHLLLQELGVITPFENRSIYDEQLMLPTVRLSRNLELLNTKTELTRRNPDFRDSMADLRRDWGSTEVYCIDNIGAKEIDDGISISKANGEVAEYWVHVHVANPTAFFDKTHVLSGLAAHMTETVYIPERSFPMLPAWTTQNYFSLDRNRPVLTFSARVDLSGEILETKIQPGIIRHVTSITPSDLSNVLGESFDDKATKLVVGGEIHSKTEKHPHFQSTPRQLEELQQLYAVARGLWGRRKAAGGVRFGQQRPEIRVFEAPDRGGLTWFPPSTDRARLIHGDPIIEFEAHSTQNLIIPTIDSRNIVEEIMTLACQVAATWCAERNIPVMYRGTVETPVSGVESLEEFRQRVVNPYLERHGQFSRMLGHKYIAVLGRAIAHSSPIPHNIIGVSSYVKVTSPLRRFSDMIAHWQIEAALRYEARTGDQFNYKHLSSKMESSPHPILPFSQYQMQESIVTLSPREKIISATKQYASHFWAVMAFMRAFYFKEAPLPDTFRVWVKHIDKHHKFAECHLIDYNLRVDLVKESDSQYQQGDEWEARIQYISPFHKAIRMEPVRLLSREDVVW